jgi:hypothetical protein
VTQKKFRLISCEVLYRELCQTTAESPHQIDVSFLPKGLHDIGSAGMVGRLQSAVDEVPASMYDAILLGYCLCNNGIAGLRSRHTPLVVPRGHDCMTLFFGSRARYNEFFLNNPGTYFFTSGWLERGEATGELRQLSIQHQAGMDADFEELVKKYGEDNARYLYDQLCDYTKHYRQITFIDMAVGPQEQFRKLAEQKAADRGWAFTSTGGDLRLIRSLVQGEWDDAEFLVVPPGQRIAVTYDEGIIKAEPADG